MYFHCHLLYEWSIVVARHSYRISKHQIIFVENYTFSRHTTTVKKSHNSEKLNFSYQQSSCRRALSQNDGNFRHVYGEERRQQQQREGKKHISIKVKLTSIRKNLFSLIFPSHSPPFFRSSSEMRRMKEKKPYFVLTSHHSSNVGASHSHLSLSILVVGFFECIWVVQFYGDIHNVKWFYWVCGKNRFYLANFNSLMRIEENCELQLKFKHV